MVRGKDMYKFISFGECSGSELGRVRCFRWIWGYWTVIGEEDSSVMALSSWVFNRVMIR